MTNLGACFGNWDVPAQPAGDSACALFWDPKEVRPGGKRDARRAESLSQYRQEQVRTRDLEDQIELEVRLALDSLRSAMSQVETAREGLTLAENELAQARRRYQAGVTNSIEVTDAQTRLDRARDNHIAALYNYNLARLDLATATGSIEEYVTQ